jgi:hypothetical protein
VYYIMSSMKRQARKRNAATKHVTLNKNWVATFCAFAVTTGLTTLPTMAKRRISYNADVMKENVTLWQRASDPPAGDVAPLLSNIERILGSLDRYPQHRDKLISDAQGMMDQALLRYPDNVDVLLSCATLGEQSGQGAQVRACLQRVFRVLRVDLDTPSMDSLSSKHAQWACQAGVLWAQLAWRQRQFVVAERWLRAAQHCSSGIAITLLPELLQTTGQFGRANEAIEQTFGRATISQLVILDREGRIREFYATHHASAPDIELEPMQDVLLALSRVGAEDKYYQALYVEQFETPALAQRYWRMYLQDERALFPARAKQHLSALAKAASSPRPATTIPLPPPPANLRRIPVP